MTAVSPMVLLLLAVALVVGIAMVLVALGRGGALGEGVDLPRRPPRGARRDQRTGPRGDRRRPARRTRSQDLR